MLARVYCEDSDICRIAQHVGQEIEILGWSLRTDFLIMRFVGTEDVLHVCISSVDGGKAPIGLLLTTGFYGHGTPDKGTIEIVGKQDFKRTVNSLSRMSSLSSDVQRYRDLSSCANSSLRVKTLTAWCSVT